ncbi:MAG TPA: 2TM domain-containing protein [Polyangiaceae bacterium]|nr:2TM domain-containing protein [Polyangiaceae bacterium]
MSNPAPRRTYSQDEVTEILKRALRQQSLRHQVLSHDELIEMADEVGIDREALEAATADLAQSRQADLLRETEARELAAERARLWNRFVSSLLTYVVVNSVVYLCFFYWLGKKVPDAAWFFWLVGAWGIALAFQLRALFFPEASLRRRKEREAKAALKAEKRAARAMHHRRLTEAFRGEYGGGARIDAGAKEFEHAVEAGVAALLGVAARKIHEHAERARQPEGFEGRRRR